MAVACVVLPGAWNGVCRRSRRRRRVSPGGDVRYVLPVEKKLGVCRRGRRWWPRQRVALSRVRLRRRVWALPCGDKS